MRLKDLLEKSTEEKPGTYAAASFDAESRKIISNYIKDNKIPNSTNVDKLHCTLLYSRAHIPNFKAMGEYSTPMKCIPNGLEIWKTQPDENGDRANCLVLKLKCPEFVARHKKLMKDHSEATYDYPEFKVHVTLSYSIGDMKIDDLPELSETLMLEKEYTTPLDTNWAKKSQ